MFIPKKLLRSNKGSTTLLFMASMLFIIVIIIFAYINVSNKKIAQERNLKQIVKQYDADIDQAYNETVKELNL